MSKTVTKADIIEHLHKDIGLNKSECKVLVEDFFNEIKNALINNEEVKLSGFGNFELLEKKKDLEEILKLVRTLQLVLEEL